SFIYTPAANFNGTDSFSYTVSDGHGGTATASVTISVNPVNDAPVAQDDSYATAEDTPLTVAAPGVLANDADVDGDALTAVLVTGPTHVTLTFNGPASFTDTTAGDFGAGTTGSSRVVAHDGDGEVTLAPAVGEEFSGTALPAGWSGAA